MQQVEEKLCSCHNLPMRHRRNKGRSNGWVCSKKENRRTNALQKRGNPEKCRTIIDNKLLEGCSYEGCDVADPDMLTFDHVADKSFNIGGSHRRTASILKREINKTQVLCANHHMKVTKMRQRGEISA
jgi:hypothetical protein